MYIYILGKVKRTHVRVQTHTISYKLYACTSPELPTYKYGDILKNSCYIALFCTHVSFQAKEVNAPKGEEQVFFMTQQGQH